jgi:osmoprotectant transport system permease protein
VDSADDPPTATLAFIFQSEFATGAAKKTGFIDWGWLKDHLTEIVLPSLLQHIFLSFVSVAIALVIALPLGVLAARKRRLYAPLTAITGFLYTIPSFSLFTIMIFILGFSVGRTPVIVALVSYSLLILIRNVVTGLDSVPAETIDAARGLGLTSRQILFRVEMPLALPVIVAGIRIATVTVIGIAVIGSYIGGGGLGDLVFDGITRDFPTMYVTGAVLATLLAILTDLVLVRTERAMSPWSRRVRRAT